MNACAASESPVPTARSQARATIAAASSLVEDKIRLFPPAASRISRAVTRAGVTPSDNVTRTVVDAPTASLTRRYSPCVPAGSVKEISAPPLSEPVTRTYSPSRSNTEPKLSALPAGPDMSWYRTFPSLPSVHPAANTYIVSTSSTGETGESFVKIADPPVGGASTRTPISADPFAPVSLCVASHRNV